MTTSAPRYDAIGHGYARTRREDPEQRVLLHAALGDARSVVNVGAGAGSYEPVDRHVIAIEPSDVMAAQRPPHLAPALKGTAGALPLRDGSVDAALAVLTVHHWDHELQAGVRELRRVARGPVVVLTYDPCVFGKTWMCAYMPELAALDHRIFPGPELLAAWLGGTVEVTPVPVRRDTPDWTLGSLWAHPERVLDPVVRAATSGFARQPPEVVERVVTQLHQDLEDGTWDREHGHLRTLDALDVGLRLVVARP